MDPQSDAAVLAVLRRFAAVARPEILRDHARDSCIASTWVAIETMHRLGLTAAPREVVATVGNGPYSALWQAYGPPASPQQLDEWSTRHGAFVVGIGHDQQRGGIGGHLICVVEAGLAVDASLDQVANTAHNLLVPPVVVFKIDPGGLPDGIIRHVTPDLFIEYVDRPVVANYRASPDWGQTVQVQAAVQRILSRLTT